MQERLKKTIRTISLIANIMVAMVQLLTAIYQIFPSSFQEDINKDEK